MKRRSAHQQEQPSALHKHPADSQKHPSAPPRQQSGATPSKQRSAHPQKHPSVPQKRPSTLIIVSLGIICLVTVVLSYAIGPYAVQIDNLLAGNQTEWDVVLYHRGPRIAAALLVGAALAGAGCAFQGIFKNPMVSPDLLGASAGAAFGAALGLLLSLGSAGVELLAFVMGLTAVAITYLLSTALGRQMRGVLVLVLCGMVIGSLFQAFISAVKFVADPNSQLPEITFWLMGGLFGVHETDLLWLLPACLAGGVVLWLLRWRINIMSNGDEEALALGVEVGRVRLLVVVAATLLTSASVAVAGMVGWVGLIIPHLARFLVGSDQRVLLPASVLLGASFLLIVDTVSRSIYTTEIPLSILTSIIGAPLFIWLIARQGRRAER